MKKAMQCIALLVTVILSLSAHTERVYKAADGYMAPELSIKDAGLNLADFRGEYVLVNFWSSTDAGSRLLAQSYNDAFSAVGSQSFRLLSLNLDSSRALFAELVERDGLSSEAQMHVDAADMSKISSDWYLSNGLRSFLIDRTGKIIAVNPSIPTLMACVGSK